jgi:hypothetical protein
VEVIAWNTLKWFLQLYSICFVFIVF